MKENKAGEIITNEVTTNYESHTATAEGEKGDNYLGIGKFKSPQALFDAYNSLQSEFTRRSQRIKELERENEKLSKEKTVVSNDGNFTGLSDVTDGLESVAESQTTKLNSDKDKVEDKLTAIKILEDYYTSNEYLKKAVIENQEIKDFIINGYLNSINTSKPTAKLITGNGQGVITPPLKPKTLAEAGEIARQIFNKLKEKF